MSEFYISISNDHMTAQVNSSFMYDRIKIHLKQCRDWLAVLNNNKTAGSRSPRHAKANFSKQIMKFINSEILKHEFDITRVSGSYGAPMYWCAGHVNNSPGKSVPPRDLEGAYCEELPVILCKHTIWECSIFLWTLYL